jgi:hypothetical protein
MKLYRIDDDLVEPRWTELGLARLLSDGALIEFVPDYDAAATAFQKHLDQQPFELMSAICDVVDAALQEGF